MTNAFYKMFIKEFNLKSYLKCWSWHTSWCYTVTVLLVRPGPEAKHKYLIKNVEFLYILLFKLLKNKK